MGARPCRLKAISYQLVEGLQRKGLSPEEWLCQVVEQRINAIFSDGPTGWFPRLIHHEIHNQTPYLNDIRKTFLSAIRVGIAKQISIYFGPQATPFQIETAVAGMMGFLPMVIEMREHRKTPLKAQEIKQLIQQLQTYVLRPCRRQATHR